MDFEKVGQPMRRKRLGRPPNFEDLSGREFGHWKVIKFHTREHHDSRWLCLCRCGVEKPVARRSLISGDSKSCGCSAIRGPRTHDMSKTRVYSTWHSMRQRCETFTYKYRYYSGRGIKVCERWKKFENFFSDMGEPPSPSHSLDRINPEGNYEPSNCRWATIEVQANNKRDTKLYTHKGESLSAAQWARKYEMPIPTVFYRLGAGWNIESALITPIHPKKSRGGKAKKPWLQNREARKQ